MMVLTVLSARPVLRSLIAQVCASMLLMALNGTDPQRGAMWLRVRLRYCARVESVTSIEPWLLADGERRGRRWPRDALSGTCGSPNGFRRA